MAKENDPHYNFVPLDYWVRDKNGEKVIVLKEIDDYVLLSFLVWDKDLKMRKAVRGWKVSGKGKLRIEGYRVKESDEILLWKHYDERERERDFAERVKEDKEKSCKEKLIEKLRKYHNDRL
jgi:hypothetical protein